MPKKTVTRNSRTTFVTQPRKFAFANLAGLRTLTVPQMPQNSKSLKVHLHSSAPTSKTSPPRDVPTKILPTTPTIPLNSPSASTQTLCARALPMHSTATDRASCRSSKTREFPPLRSTRHSKKKTSTLTSKPHASTTPPQATTTTSALSRMLEQQATPPQPYYPRRSIFGMLALGIRSAPKTENFEPSKTSSGSTMKKTDTARSLGAGTRLRSKTAPCRISRTPAATASRPFRLLKMPPVPVGPSRMPRCLLLSSGKNLLDLTFPLPQSRRRQQNPLPPRATQRCSPFETSARVTT